MLKTSSPTSSLIISQSIDVVNENGVGESGGNETNLSNLSVLTRSTGAGYITSGDTKRGGGNTKKSVEATKGSDYLTSAAKKAFNQL